LKIFSSKNGIRNSFHSSSIVKSWMLLLVAAWSTGETLANGPHAEAARKLVSGSCLDPELIIRQNSKLALRVLWQSVAPLRFSPLCAATESSALLRRRVCRALATYTGRWKI
jgi:hypothetical protein